MTELPNGWVETVLDEIAATALGKMLDAKQRTGLHQTPYLRNVNVRWGTFDLSDVATMDIEPRELDRVLAQPGDLVACEGGEPGRSAVWRGREAVALQKALHKIQPAAGVLPDYLGLLLREQSSTGELDKLFTGTTIKHLPQEKLRLVTVPLAPTCEQERIVAAIEEAFSKLDAGEAGLRTVRQLLKRMRDAVFAAAVTGRLVPQDPADTPAPKLLADIGVEPLDSPTLVLLPEFWAWASMGDVTVIGGGIQKQPKRTPSRNPTPFLRVANVGRGTLALDDVHLIEVFEGELDRYGLERGDLLVVEGNGSPDQIGRSAMWHGSIDPCVHQNHLIRVRPSDVLLPEFLELYWNSPAASRRVQSVASSTSGLHTLSTGKLKVLPVAIPPLEEQARIVSEVERQVSFLDACEQGIDGGQACAAALRRSVLKAAFEGQLVPQDPTDEPASVLLERVRAERAAPNAPRRSRRPA